MLLTLFQLGYSYNELINKFFVQLITKPNAIGSVKTLVVVVGQSESDQNHGELAKIMWEFGINVVLKEKINYRMLDQNCNEDSLIVVLDPLKENINTMLSSNYLMECSWLIRNVSVIFDEVLNLRLDSLLYLFEEEHKEIRVFELFAVKSKLVISNELFTWQNDNDVSTLGKPNNIWMRRSNFHNITLVNTGLFWRDINTVYDGQNEEPDGVFPEVLRRLQELMHFKLNFTSPADMQWGFRFPNGTWNGIVEQVQSDKNVDMSATGLTITSERSEVLDFTVGVLHGDITLYIGVPLNQEINWAAFLHIFEPLVWILIAGSLFILAIALSLVDKKPFASAIVLQLLLLGQRDSPWSWNQHQNLTAAKFIFMFSSIFSFIIFSHYTADLTSLMTSGIADPPINSFQDILDRDLTLIWTPNTAEEQTLEQAESDSAMNKVYKKMLKSPEFTKYLDWTLEDEHFANLLHSNPKYVSYGTTISIKRHGIRALSFDETSATHLGIALKKGSEFKKIFDYHLIYMRESGILHQIESKWLQGRISGKETRKDDFSAITLSYANLLFPFTTLIIGIMAAVFTLISETAALKREKIYEK